MTSGWSRFALLAAAIGLTAAIAACAAGPRPQLGPHDVLADNGGAFAARACAGCHAVALKGVSPDPAAPPFRMLATRRPLDDVRVALSRVAQHGHGDMPPIYMTDEEQQAVLAYIRRLRGRTLPHA